MMKKIISLFLFAFFILETSNAQVSDYDKTAAEIKADIWGGKDADFENNSVPEQYKNESAIILAKRYDIEAKIKKHFRLSMAIGNKEIIFRYLLRQKVLLQDKSALDDFSEISYNKVNKSSYGYLWGKQTDDLSTYIGARVYKKDGTIQEVLLSEAVLVTDEKNKKDEKLAIPNLQVGDILDYYIVSLEKREMSSIDPMQFLMAGEFPILKLSLQGNIDKRYAVEYKCINGTPDLKITKDEDGDMQFNLKMTDLAKFPVTEWISPLRQAKMVRLKISLCGGNYSNCRAGEITKGVTEDEIYNTQKNHLRSIAFAYAKGLFGSAEKSFVKENVKSLKKRLGKEPPPDSLIYTIYNSLRYYGYYTAAANDKIFPGKAKNQATLPSNLFGVLLSLSLKDYDIDNELIFYSSRYMPKIEDLMSYDQPVFMVHAKGSTDHYLTDDGIFSQCDLVPGYAEGEKGVTLEYDDVKALYRDKAKHMDQGSARIPVSKADKNKVSETLNISLVLGATPATTVERKITSTGLMKEDGQKSLMLFEDYYLDAWKEQGEDKTFIQEFEDSRRTKSLAEEWQNSFTKARETYKDAFMDDLKSDYDMEPKELISYKVEKSGVRQKDPAFMYSTRFVMPDWIKKAGNNYLFEIGKVIGTQWQVREEDRKRTIDIYAPFARSFEFQINIEIPAGYSVEGAEALNKKIENECGGFVSTATVQGNQLLVHVKKEYSNNFEPAANWPKILSFIDASGDFNNAKVLLKKK
jgi:hypothetical protein